MIHFHGGAEGLLSAIDSLGMAAGIALETVAGKLQARRVKDSNKAALEDT